MTIPGGPGRWCESKSRKSKELGFYWPANRLDFSSSRSDRDVRHLISIRHPIATLLPGVANQSKCHSDFSHQPCLHL